MSGFNEPRRDPPYLLPPQCPLCQLDILGGQSRAMWWPSGEKFPVVVHRTCRDARLTDNQSQETKR